MIDDPIKYVRDRSTEDADCWLWRQACTSNGTPTYAIDAPVIAGQVAASSEVTKSATALLKEAGSALSARAFNALALERGFLAKVTRAGSKGIKEFLVVTDAGLRWGKNVISPQNPRESQPHWYSRSFPALLAELN